MTHVGFVGTGLMGSPMAKRLVDQGHKVTVWNRTPERADYAVSLGAQRARSFADFAPCDAVITMVTDPAALLSVISQPGGLGEHLGPMATLIEMSTVGPAAIFDIGRLIDPRAVLDAPVLGSVPQAIDGSLQIFVGGDAETYKRYEPLLACLGTPRHVGPVGSGASLKLVLNAALLSLMCTLGEAMAIADSLGLDETTVLDALEDSPLGITTSKKRHNIESGDYSPRFCLDNGVKDARLIAAAAAAAAVHAPIADSVLSWYIAAAQSGLGDEDYSAVIKYARSVREIGSAGKE